MPPKFKQRNYIEGEQAFKAGVKLNDCPYNNWRRAGYWRRGWLAAQEDGPNPKLGDLITIRFGTGPCHTGNIISIDGNGLCQVIDLDSGQCYYGNPVNQES